MAAIQNMSLANENTLKTEHFMPLYPFSNFCNFHDFEDFFERQTRGIMFEFDIFKRYFDGDVKNFVLVDFGVSNTIKNDKDWLKHSEFSFLLVNFRGFLTSQLKNI